MQKFTIGYAGLYPMPQGMPQIQEGTHTAGFSLVFLDYFSFDGDILCDDGGEAIDGVEGEAEVDFIGQSPEGMEHAGLADGCVFDHLGHAFPQHARGQGEQGRGVDHYEGGLMEGTDEVLAGGYVHGCLAAN